MSLMSYIPSPTAAGPRKYHGTVATGYDAKRDESPKWKAEQYIIEGMIDGFEGTVLDIPVGTGRFIPAYERNGLQWLGVDLSADMLHEASAKVTKPELASLMTGDVTRIGEFGEGGGPDYTIMCRLTRWLTPEQRAQALRNLQRVTRKAIIFTARVDNHPYAYPMEDIEAALDGWKIVDNIECAEPDYRIIRLEVA